MSVWSLLLCAAVFSVVELDLAAAGQFMVARPIVLGPLAGAALGDALLGAGLGLLYELFSLADPPVGGYLPINPTVALASALVLSLGAGGWPPACAFPAGLTFGWLHSRVETLLRHGRVKTVRQVESRLALSEDPRLARLAGLELARQAAATFAVLAFAVAGRLVLPGCPGGWLDSGLRFGLALAPWIGLAALFKALRMA